MGGIREGILHEWFMTNSDGTLPHGRATKDQDLHGLVNHLEAHMKGEDGEALERNRTYKKEKSAEKGGQILVEGQTKEGTFA